MASWIRASAVVCALVLIAACGGGEDQVTPREAEFAAIEQQKAALEAKRQEVARLAEQLAAANAMMDEAGEEAVDEAEAAEGEEAAAEEMPSTEELEQQLAAARNEAQTMGEEFMTALVEFLNSANMVQGEEPSGVLLEAIRMKSAEDLVIAQEYINRGGDYRRAIEILQTALMLDPDNPELVAALEQAKADQYMTEERFAQVTKGMTMEQVRERIGTVNVHNVREYPEKDVTAWFYRREDKGAAGVYFQDKDGEMVVYRADFNAITPEGEESEG